MFKSLQQKSKALSVLYVEDDINLRDATISFLQEFFQKIDTAANGKEGLDHYEKGRYDIVISDISMPVMDGIEMCRVIRAADPEQQIVITSAHDDISYMTDLMKLGIGHFISKPMEIDVIVRVLDDVCNAINYRRKFLEPISKIGVCVNSDTF